MASIDALDHVVLAVPDIAAAAARFEALGLNLSPVQQHQGMGTENRVFFLPAGESEFYVEMLAICDESEAKSAGLDSLIAKVAAGGGLLRLMLRTADLPGLKASLDVANVETKSETIRRADGSTICNVLRPAGAPGGCEVGILQYSEELAGRVGRHREHGLFEHSYPLKRADHVAVFVSGLEDASRFWNQVLGAPTVGEITTPAMIIRQIQGGDCMIELLAASSPDSPLANRPPGLASMVAFEVQDISAAISQARAAGFTAPDVETGVIPGTVRSSIPAGECAGLGVQLIAYV